MVCIVVHFEEDSEDATLKVFRDEVAVRVWARDHRHDEGEGRWRQQGDVDEAGVIIDKSVTL